jgi:glycogen debranching enzyme
MAVIPGAATLDPHMGEDSVASAPEIDLLPGETVVSNRRISAQTHRNRLDAADTLAALARVDSPARIGQRGPVLAAIARPGDDDPALHSFEAVFGRDSLVSALSVGSRFPRLLLETVRYLAAHQGLRTDESKQEEPGKIPHEIRAPDDPVARKLTADHGWGWPYYGSIDATPLFLLACDRCAAIEAGSLDALLTREDGSVTSLRQSLRKAAEWLVGKLESSAAGFLESPVPPGGGLANQTWKDSWDAYSAADGKIVKPPFASVEVQALAFDAARAAAGLLASQAPGLAARLRAAASQVRKSVLRIMWLDRSGYFALAARQVTAHGRYEPLAVSTSNMGHLLDSQLLADAECAQIRRRMIESLFGPAMLTAGGVRTLGVQEVRYRAGSYHNGSCWPWDTAKIARGLRRFGFHSLAGILTRCVLDVCEVFGGFPEFCRGDADSIRFNDRIVDIRDPSGRLNRIEQPPQQIQAWTVAAVIELEAEHSSPSHRRHGAPKADQRLEAQLVEEVLERHAG